MFEEPTETNDINLKLVQEIEKHPVLYESLRSQKKSVIDKAWQEVAEALNISVPTCRYNWHNLKTVFKRRVRSSRDGPKKRPCFLTKVDKAMKFYLPYMDPKSDMIAKSKNKRLKSQNITFTPQTFTPQNATEEIVDSIGTYDNNTLNKLILIGNKTPSNVMNLDQQYVSDYLTPEKEILQMNEEEVNFERINMLQSAKMFLLSLLPELEELSDYQMKLFKRRVLSAIDEVSNSCE